MKKKKDRWNDEEFDTEDITAPTSIVVLRHHARNKIGAPLLAVARKCHTHTNAGKNTADHHIHEGFIGDANVLK